MSLERLPEQKMKRTARVGGVVIDVDRLIESASQFVETTLSAADLFGFRSHDRGWSTATDESIGPKHIIDLASVHAANYEQMIAAQPTWKEHIDRVRFADLTVPILVTEDVSIIDGAHRVTKMFVEHVGAIRAKKIPQESLLKFVLKEGLVEKEPIKVRTATARDASSIARIHRESMVATYTNESHGISEADLLEYCGDPSVGVLRWHSVLVEQSSNEHTTVLMEGTRVVGFCRSHREDAQGVIEKLYLDPARSGKGLGADLLRESIQWIGADRPVSLEVVAYNDRAIRFYERNGFRVQGPADSLVLPNGKEIPIVSMVRDRQEG